MLTYTGHILVIAALFAVFSCNRQLPSASNTTQVGNGASFSGADQSVLLDAVAQNKKAVTLVAIGSPAAIKAAAKHAEQHQAVIEASSERLGFLVLTMDPKAAMEFPSSVALSEVFLDSSAVVEREKTTIASQPSNRHLDLTNVKQLSRHARTKGEKVSVAVIDTGLDLAHPAFLSNGRSRVAAIEDFSGDGDVLLTKAERVAGLPEAEAYWRGQFTEQGREQTALADLNKNGSSSDSFPIILYKTARGFFVRIDDEQNGFADDEELADFNTSHQTVALGLGGALKVGVRIVDSKGALRTKQMIGGEQVPLIALFFDGIGHGTHVAGIIAGNDPAHPELAGGAPEVEIHALKVEDSKGKLRLSAIVKALAYLDENKIAVANMSLNNGLGSSNDQLLDQMINTLVTKAKVVISASAGNNGPLSMTVTSPGSAALAITTGGFLDPVAMRALGFDPKAKQAGVWYGSSRGPTTLGFGKPDIVAPAAVFSSIPLWQAALSSSPVSGYASMIGTSMAAPITTASLALLISAARRDGLSASPAMLALALRSSARLLPEHSPFAQGTGVLQASNALAALKGMQGKALISIVPEIPKRTQRVRPFVEQSALPKLSVSSSTPVNTAIQSDNAGLIPEPGHVELKQGSSELRLKKTESQLEAGSLIPATLLFRGNHLPTEAVVALCAPIALSAKEELVLAGVLNRGQTKSLLFSVPDAASSLQISIEVEGKDRLKAYLGSSSAKSMIVGRPITATEPLHSLLPTGGKVSGIMDLTLDGDVTTASVRYQVRISLLSIKLEKISWAKKGGSLVGQLTILSQLSEADSSTYSSSAALIGRYRAMTIKASKEKIAKLGLELPSDANTLRLSMLGTAEDRDVDMALVSGSELIESTSSPGQTDSLSLELFGNQGAVNLLLAAASAAGKRTLPSLQLREEHVLGTMPVAEIKPAKAKAGRFIEEISFPGSALPPSKAGFEYFGRYELRDGKGKLVFSVQFILPSDPKEDGAEQAAAVPKAADKAQAIDSSGDSQNGDAAVWED